MTGTAQSVSRKKKNGAGGIRTPVPRRINQPHLRVQSLLSSRASGLQATAFQNSTRQCCLALPPVVQVWASPLIVGPHLRRRRVVTVAV